MTGQDGVGYKFCLAVAFDKSYKDYHFAFSAATGQVADNHDLLEITTRYLAASDAEFDDSSLPSMNATSSSSSLGTFFWVMLIISMCFVWRLGCGECDAVTDCMVVMWCDVM